VAVQSKQKPKKGKKQQYCSIGQASAMLGVSIATLRRWEKAGKIKAERLDGKNRSFKVADLEKLTSSKPLSTAETAKLLKVSESSVRRLQQRGELVGERGDNGKYLFSQDSIDTYKQAKAAKKASKAAEPTLAEMIEQETEKRLEEAEDFLEHDNEGYISPAEIPHPFLSGIVAAVATIALLITPWKTMTNTSNTNTGPVSSTTTTSVAKPAEKIDGKNILDRTVTGAKLTAGSIDLDKLSTDVQQILKNNRITSVFNNQNSYNTYNTSNVYNTTNNSGGSSVSAGTGISVTTNVNDQTISANYGSQAGTAAEGNKLITCPTGSGNLTGGGNSVVVGAGGTCNSLGIVNNPTFTGQVTAGALTSSGTVTFSSLGAGLVRSSVTGELSTNFVQNSDFDSTQIYSNLNKLNNVTIGGQLAVSGLANGIVKSTGGVLSGGNTVTLGADTTGSYIQNLGTLTGLTTTGNTGAGSTPSISVAYGSTANTSVQGNRTIICPSGTGNLSGTGNTITLGSGGTCNSLSIVNNPTFSGLMTSLGVNAGTITATDYIETPTLSATSMYAAYAEMQQLSVLPVNDSNGVFMVTDSYANPILAVDTADTTYNNGRVNISGRQGFGIVSTPDNNSSDSQSIVLVTGHSDFNSGNVIIDTGSAGNNSGYIEIGTGNASGVSIGSAYIPTTIGGQLTVSGLTNGIVKATAGVLSGGNKVALGTDTTGSYIQNLGTLTGLTTTGNTGAGSTPTLAVTYGSTANTSVQGNRTIICPSGTGNLSGTGNTITLGSGGTCNSLSIVNNPTFSGLLTASNTGSTALSVSGAPTASATSSLVQIGSAIAGGNSTATTGGTYIGLNAPSTGAGSTADFLNFQSNGTSKLKVDISGNTTLAGTLGVTGNTTLTGTLTVNSTSSSSIAGLLNLTATGTGLSVTNSATIGTGLTVTSGGATITSGNLNVTAGDINTAGTQRLTNAGALNNITGYSQSSGNFLQSGTGTFGTATGSISLNGNTTIASGKTLSVGGNTSVSGNLSLTRTNGTGLNYVSAGTWGVLQDRNLGADTGNGNNYRTIFANNAYVSDMTTNTYSQINAYGNKWAWELGGTQTSLRYRAGAGGVAETWTDTGWTDLMTVSNTSATFKSGSNSTTAFQIQNASATPLLLADTTNGIVAVRNYSANEALAAGSDLLGGVNWTDNGNWNGAGTNASTNTFQHITSGGTSPYTQTLTNTWYPTSTSNYYQISFTVANRTTGSFTMAMGGVTSNTWSSTGTWSVKPISATISDFLTITPTADFNGTITFTVKQLTASSLSPTLRVTDSAGSAALEVRTGGLTSAQNSFIGYNSGRYNTTGFQNTGFGYSALRDVISGYGNTAMGSQSQLVNTAGSWNTSFGAQSLLANTVGWNNAAFGAASLASNTTGSNNTAFGTNALYSNTTASSNTAVGYYSQFLGTTATQNTSVGFQSLYNNLTGGNNTALGHYSGRSLLSGSTNTFVGYVSGYDSGTVTTTTTANSGGGASPTASTTLPVTSVTGIALGEYVSGTGITNGTYVAGISGLNITLSQNATVNSGTSVSFAIQRFDASNTTAIGNGTLTTANNQIILGNSSVNQVNIQGNPSNSIYQTTTAGTTISSLLQLGNRLTSSSANTSSNGGTYFGINAPSSGTGSAADFINLQNNGTSVLTVGSTGNTVHKTSTNSATAFQIQNAAGSSLLTVDTLTTSNLLTNGDMESSTNSTAVYGWATVGTGTTFQQTTPTWQGKYALSVAATAGNANGGASNSYTFAANTTYTLSFYARVPSGTITDLVAGRQEISGTDITCLTGQTLTTTYTRFSCTFTTGATITSSNIFIQRSGTAAETFLIDGVQLQLGSSASTFNVGGAPQFSFNTSKLQVMNSAGTTNYLSVDTVNNRTNLGGTLVTNATNVSPDGARNGVAIILDPTTSASNVAAIAMTNGSSYRYALRTAYSGSSFDVYLGDNQTALVNSVVLQPGSTGYAGVDLPSTTGTQTNGFWVNRSAAGGTTTNMVNIQNSAGTATNALTFTGTFTNLINSTNFTVSNGGNVTLNVASSSAGFALCTVANGAGTKTIEDCAAAPSADYAEQYPLASGIGYGDIVATGSKVVNTYADENGSVNWDKVKGQITELVRSSSVGQSNTVGVVSDNYGDFTSAGHNIKEEDNPMPVALNGRVPVNMAPDSEPVSAGDYLTTSGTYPGKATKATGAGYVIGKALASWSSGQEQVMVFVEPGYNSGPGAVSYIQDGGSASLVNLTVNGTLEVKGLLKVADIEVNGHIITKGNTPQITAKDASGSGANVSIDGNDISGTITITAGNGATAGDLAEVTFNKVYGAKPRVILSASNDKAAKLQLFKTASSSGFVLKAADGSTPADGSTYEIDYQIMQ